ncbi:MAG: DUF2012 domain-containing protein, partial [Chloroflexota bacterium]
MSHLTIKLKHKTSLLLLVLLALMVVVIPAAAQSAPPPVVRFEVNPQTAKVGDTVTVAVRLENVSGLFGLQVICQVDPNVIAGTTHLEGDAFSGGNSFYVDQGMKPDGKWLIAATRLQPNPAFSGNGTAFSFQYTLKSATNANFACSVLGADNHSMPLPLTLVNGTPVVTLAVEATAVIPTAIATQIVPTSEVPTAEATEVVPTAEATEIVPTAIVPTPEVTEIAPTAEATEVVPTEVLPTSEATTEPTMSATVSSTVQGTIVNQFAADSGGVQIQLTSNGSLVQQSVTAADGSFSFANVPAGSYVLLVSAPEHLALVYNITVGGDGAPINLASQTFLIGDTDGNQTIDVADAALISANFDQAVPPAPQAADLN